MTKKDPAAVALGRRGGRATARKMTKAERAAAAKKAADARWGKGEATMSAYFQSVQESRLTLKDIARAIGCHPHTIRLYQKQGKLSQPSDGIYTDGDIQLIRERFPQLTQKRKKATYLNATQLVALHTELRAIEFREKGDGRLAFSNGRQPWDSEDEKRITCLLCGIQLTSLAGRGKSHYDHLRDDHADIVGDGDFESRITQYQNYCESQSLGRPPVTCLAERKRKDAYRQDPTNASAIRDATGRAKAKQKHRWQTEPEYRRHLFDQNNRRALNRRQKRLTAAAKAELIQCPILLDDGTVCGAFVKRLSQHAALRHGRSTAWLNKNFPHLPLSTPSDTTAQQMRAAAARADSDRLKNLEGVDIRTGRRISLAAHRSLDGLNPWAMGKHVYPDSQTPGDSIKKLFSNHRSRIDSEKKRISALPESKRRSEAEDLQSRLSADLAKGKSNSR